MPAIGSFHGSILGTAEPAHLLAAAGSSTTAMASLNTGLCYRFTANDTRDIKTVYLRFGTVTAAGQVTMRVETVNTSTGKPTGNLYDASASIVVTPTANTWVAFTPASLPTAGLVPGTEYGITWLTTTGGTTMNVTAPITVNRAEMLPMAVLTAADGTTRTNFAEVSGAVPMCSIVYEDDVEEPLGLGLAAGAQTTVTGTTAVGAKVTLSAPVKVSGVSVIAIRAANPPASDVVCKIYSGSTVVATSHTVSANSLNTQLTGGRRVAFAFPSVVTLAAGIYRVMVQNTNTGAAGSLLIRYSTTARSVACVPQGIIGSTTSDITAGTISWSDTTTDMPSIGLILSDQASAAYSRSRVVNG